MVRDIIVIGASAGGVEALKDLLSSLPHTFEATVFVTLHVSPHAESLLPEILQRSGHLPAQHAKNGAKILPGRIYVAPPDYHLMFEDGVMRLSHGPKENRHRPAVDPMFRSAAEVYGARVAGVLLTGNLDDGVAGLRDVQKHGGLTIVQDPTEAPFPDMPRNALGAVRVVHCLPLKRIEELLKRLPDSGAGGKKMRVRKGAHAKRYTNHNEKQSTNRIAVEPKNGEPVSLACPECQGPVWEIRDGKVARFECLVGHRYSLESLVSAQAEEVEQSLWVALRALEERVTLQRRLAGRSYDAGRARGRQYFLAKAKDNERHAKVLRDMLQKLGD